MTIRKETLVVDIFIFIIIVCAVFFSIYIPKLTTKAISEEASGGEVTLLNLGREAPDMWYSIFGHISTDYPSSNIYIGRESRKTIEFDAKLPECDRAVIYFTELDSIDWDDLEPATTEDLNNYLDIDKKDELSVDEYFKEGRYFEINGEKKILKSIKTSSPSNLHYTGILKSKGKIIYVTTVLLDVKVFNDRKADYQIMFGLRKGNTERMLFFIDPVDEKECFPEETEDDVDLIGNHTTIPPKQETPGQIEEEPSLIQQKYYVDCGCKLFMVQLLCLLFLLIDIGLIAGWLIMKHKEKEEKEQDIKEKKQKIKNS